MMENSEEAVDDQGSGWLEVKKKHRSSSKFSMQSWVGGFPAKNAGNSMRGQHLLNEKSGTVQGKFRSQLQTSGRNVDVHSRGGLANSIAEGNEDKKDVCYLNKCVVKLDHEDPIPPSLFVKNTNGSCAHNPKIPSKEKHPIVHKIKWGDLEDDVLVAHHENNIGTEIKFGDIGNHNVLGCRKHENACDSLSCSSCTNLQESMLEASVGVDGYSCQKSPLTLNDETCKEVNESSSEVMIAQTDSDKIISEDDGCNEIHTEDIKPTQGNQVYSSFQSCQPSETAATLEVPDVMLEVGKQKVSEAPSIDCGSRTEIVSKDTVSLSPENSGSEALRESIMPDCIQDARIPNDLSKAEIITALGEADAGEGKERFRERLWCFLFENLNRAVDELYLLCELECDLEQMKEAILVLEEAASDFKELTSRVEEFETVKKNAYDFGSANSHSSLFGRRESNEENYILKFRREEKSTWNQLDSSKEKSFGTATGADESKRRKKEKYLESSVTDRLEMQRDEIRHERHQTSDIHLKLEKKKRTLKGIHVTPHLRLSLAATNFFSRLISEPQLTLERRR